MSELKHKRVLVKFSGESVAGNDEHGIDPKILNDMAASVKSCKDIGAEIGIVIGGGNLFRGEKWFCNLKDAEDAGWRPSKR